MVALAPHVPADPSDAVGVGLVLASVGGFLLANSIVFRHPRTLLAEFFGGKRGKLTSIRGYIFHRLQIHLGFLFLLLGFGFQLYGHYQPSVPGPVAEEASSGFPLPWVGLVLLAVGILEVGGWLLSHALFQRYLREYFRTHPPDLEADMELTRELGELFGIPSTGDDTVPGYLMRVRRAVGLDDAPPARPAASSPEGATYRVMGPEEGLV